jgi:hypothetical protein
MTLLYYVVNILLTYKIYHIALGEIFQHHDNKPEFSKRLYYVIEPSMDFKIPLTFSFAFPAFALKHGLMSRSH